jgi:hypothetical protein
MKVLIASYVPSAIRERHQPTPRVKRWSQNRMIRISRTIALATLLSGCASAANQHAIQVATSAKSSMIGMTREQVLACAGIPQNKATEEHTEVWQYAGDGINVGFSSGGGTATATGFGNTANIYSDTSSVGISRRRSCQVSIVMEEGKVAAVNFNGSGSKALCAVPLTNCVPPIPE